MDGSGRRHSHAGLWASGFRLPQYLHAGIQGRSVQSAGSMTGARFSVRRDNTVGPEGEGLKRAGRAMGSHPTVGAARQLHLRGPRQCMALSELTALRHSVW